MFINNKSKTRKYELIDHNNIFYDITFSLEIYKIYNQREENSV